LAGSVTSVVVQAIAKDNLVFGIAFRGTALAADWAEAWRDCLGHLFAPVGLCRWKSGRAYHSRAVRRNGGTRLGGVQT